MSGRTDSAGSPELANGSKRRFEHGLSNGRVEAINTTICLLTRVAFGFRDVDALFAFAMFSLAGPEPALPGRNDPLRNVRRAA